MKEEKILIRLEIPNVSKLEAISVESRPISCLGLDWKFVVTSDTCWKSGSLLKCGVKSRDRQQKDGITSIDATMKVRILKNDGETGIVSKETAYCYCQPKFVDLLVWRKELYTRNDTIRLELCIKIKSVSVIHDFSTNTPFTDVVLVVDGKELHVNKQILSIKSSYFAVMFNGRFIEANEQKINIYDVEYYEFVFLLNFIYNYNNTINEANIKEICILSDRFMVPSFRDAVKTYIFQSNYQEIFVTCETPELNEEFPIAELKEMFTKKYMSQYFPTIVNTLEVSSDFEMETEYSDMILIVGGKRFHVNRLYLSIISPIFKSMFYDDNDVAKNIDTIRIEHEKHVEFETFLNFAYNYKSEIKLRNYKYLLKLAHRFNCKHVKNLCEDYFIFATRDLLSSDPLAHRFYFGKLKDFIQRINQSGNAYYSVITIQEYRPSTKEIAFRRINV